MNTNDLYNEYYKNLTEEEQKDATQLREALQQRVVDEMGYEYDSTLFHGMQDE